MSEVGHPIIMLEKGIYKMSDHSLMNRFSRALAILVVACGLTGCLQGAGKFQQFDQDGSGTLSPKEIAQGLIELTDDSGDGVLTARELTDGFRDIGLLNNWDFDDDGDVDALDFTFIFTDESNDPDNRFELWDTDDNRRLDTPELAAALFEKFDLNRDDLLDPGEVQSLVVFYKVIEAYDGNGDQELSYQEFLEAAATVR